MIWKKKTFINVPFFVFLLFAKMMNNLKSLHWTSGFANGSWIWHLMRSNQRKRLIPLFYLVQNLIFSVKLVFPVCYASWCCFEYNQEQQQKNKRASCWTLSFKMSYFVLSALRRLIVVTCFHVSVNLKGSGSNSSSMLPLSSRGGTQGERKNTVSDGGGVVWLGCGARWLLVFWH